MEILAMHNVEIVDKWLQIYLIFLLMDFATGFMKAYRVEGFKSRKLRDGVIRVITELMAIVFAGVLDFAFGLNILMVSTKTLFIFKEAISLVENFGILGVELPDILKNKIQDLNPQKNQEEEEEEDN